MDNSMLISIDGSRVQELDRRVTALEESVICWRREGNRSGTVTLSHGGNGGSKIASFEYENGNLVAVSFFFALDGSVKDMIDNTPIGNNAEIRHDMRAGLVVESDLHEPEELDYGLQL